jgi:hypothetical protein
MGPMRRPIVATIVAALVLLVMPATAEAAGQVRARAGAAYLADQQKANGSIPAFSAIGSTADAVLAFTAVGDRPRARTRAIGFLRRQVRKGRVDTVGEVAKVLMAVVAGGRDPRSFGGSNLVKELRSQIGNDGHIGDATVFDQALGILALEATGIQPARRVTRWLADAQCPVGGWSFDAPYASGTDDENCHDGTPDDFFTADTNTTSYAVMALAEVGRSGEAAPPFPFLKGARDATHGGWGYTPGFDTDANSTALVIQAYVAAGRRIPKGAMKALRDLQPDIGCGAWSFTYVSGDPGPPDVGATIGAIPAIVRASFPLEATPRTTRSRPTRGC